ncbi:hypothetical protein E2C01_038849 [Portunus trituberculatus]|uniref:Uncharacterized protein n=1 Tax=Portunus trituberculatus TaxID=210409 RepID=A0A5B7FD84_PORTR|nr:hypothetical protein [Portunus trituberculatus]
MTQAAAARQQQEGRRRHRRLLAPRNAALWLALLSPCPKRYYSPLRPRPLSMYSRDRDQQSALVCWSPLHLQIRPNATRTAYCQAQTTTPSPKARNKQHRN